MALIKDLILQVTFILFPIFIYQSLWLNQSLSSVPKTNKLLIYFLSSVSAILCFTYPLNFFIVDDIPFTLFGIPLFISIVYGGYLTGTLVILTTFLFRLYGTDFEALSTLLIIPLYVIFPFLLVKKWSSFKKSQKFLWVILFGTIKTVLVIVGLIALNSLQMVAFTFEKHLWLDFAGGGAFLILILLLAVYATEYIKENAMLRTQIIKSEKLSIVSELAASVAHEVRNPLTVVRGFIQLIGDEDGYDHLKKKEYVKLVLTELDRAQEIITDYLNLARHQYFAKKKLNISIVLHEVANLMTSYANYKTVTISAEIEDNLHVYGDATRLKQVFINLVKNSIEAVPELDGNVVIKAYASHEVIRVKIIDNGIGMSPEQIVRLGEPYFTLKEKGTGLGLTVTFSIIEHHNGTIRFQSELTKGTSVTVSFPFFREEDSHQID
ncbi:ATP-binding protein [Metabacillus herbersteinensis]|uniref:histidine kinase n=1 Tax=Metabacillus herbersteinensis TaxID=283816 RepID=A0ABV6GBR7_9BACI